MSGAAHYEPLYSKDRSITDVHFMDNNKNWSKVVQSMKSGRMGHASIYDGTDDCLPPRFFDKNKLLNNYRTFYKETAKRILHLGGYGEQAIESWNILDDGFMISDGNSTATNVVNYPYCFIIN